MKNKKTSTSPVKSTPIPELVTSAGRKTIKIKEAEIETSTCDLEVTDPLTARTHSIKNTSLVVGLQKIASKLTSIVSVYTSFNQADAVEFLRLYTKNRKTSAPRSIEYGKSMLEGTWVEGFPNLALASDGTIINGAHTVTGFYYSGLDKMNFWVLLGCDPEIATRLDTGKIRDLSDQAYYMEDDIYDGIPGGIQDKKNFVTCASYIFGYLSSHEIWPSVNLTFREARKKLVQNAYGRQLLRQVKPHFIKVYQILDDCYKESLDVRGKDGDRYYLQCKKSVIYIPFVLLLMLNNRRYNHFITGALKMAGLKTSDPIHKLGARLRSEIVSESGVRREEEETGYYIHLVLSYFYAKDNGVTVPSLLPRHGNPVLTGDLRSSKKDILDAKMNNGICNIWSTHSFADRSKDFALRSKIMGHFLKNVREPKISK